MTENKDEDDPLADYPIDTDYCHVESKRAELRRTSLSERTDQSYRFASDTDPENAEDSAVFETSVGPRTLGAGFFTTDEDGYGKSLSPKQRRKMSRLKVWDDGHRDIGKKFGRQWHAPEPPSSRHRIDPTKEEKCYRAWSVYCAAGVPESIKNAALALIDETNANKFNSVGGVDGAIVGCLGLVLCDTAEDAVNHPIVQRTIETIGRVQIPQRVATVSTTRLGLSVDQILWGERAVYQAFKHE